MPANSEAGVNQESTEAADTRKSSQKELQRDGLDAPVITVIEPVEVTLRSIPASRAEDSAAASEDEIYYIGTESDDGTIVYSPKDTTTRPPEEIMISGARDGGASVGWSGITKDDRESGEAKCEKEADEEGEEGTEKGWWEEVTV